MSRKIDSIKNLALHASTGEAEWQAAAIAYFRILRANGGKEPVDKKPQGVRMEAAGFYTSDPYYPHGAAAARADAEARRQSEFYRSTEYQRQRQEEIKRQREAKAAADKARRDREEEMLRKVKKKMEEGSFSSEFNENWYRNVGQDHASDAFDAQRMAEEIYRRANGV